MKAPDAALLRARAKAPLHDLQALHLSSADLACLRNLESCQQLRSLYASGNALTLDIDGLTYLRQLWRVDLSDNALRTLAPLASFAALGFVHVERNHLSYGDLLCLRNVHILELRVAGNRFPLSTVSATATTESRQKLVALLPCVWILDGHYVTSHERALALETYDGFVQQLLLSQQSSSSSSSSSMSSLRFGSTSDLWGGSSLVLSGDTASPVQQEALELLQTIAAQPTRHATHQDLYRLRAIAAFHDRESAVHNAYTRFAPSKHALAGREMAQIRLSDALALPPRTRLELSVLLATHLSFPLPGKLLTEALTITLLGCSGSGGNSSCWSEQLAMLPAYAHVALVSAMRSRTMEELETTPSFVLSPLEHLLWGTLPAVIPTLLTTERHTRLVDADVADQAFVQRCAFAVALLTRTASFPDLSTVTKASAKSSSSSLLSSLVDLVEAARLASVQTLESVGFAFPSVLLSFNDKSPWRHTKNKSMERAYRRPWRETPTSSTEDGISLSPLRDHHDPSVGIKRRRLPKPGEWLELTTKVYIRIRSVSADGAFVTATGTSDTSGSVTLRMDQIHRISSSMWRLVDDDSDGQLLSAVLSQLGHAVPSKSRLGKLHRDSEAFHRHGAARNQGFPNQNVSLEELRGLVNPEPLLGITQPQPVELFSSADTLDANYVLTSPALVSMQNACAVRAFVEKRQVPGGLWRPIQITSSIHVQSVDTPSKNTSQSASIRRKMKKNKTPDGSDWLQLQLEMQALLGIHHQPTLLPQSQDVQCFLTAVPPEDHDREPSEDELSSSYNYNATAMLSRSASSPSVSTYPSLEQTSVSKAPRSSKPKKLAALSWHQVATKPQLLVASSALVGSSSPQPLRHSALMDKGVDGAFMPPSTTEPSAAAVGVTEPEQSPASRPGSSLTRVPLRLTRCHVSLPSLLLESQK